MQKIVTATRCLLLSLMALGSAASSMTLGESTVRSNLGNPLVVDIAYQIGAGETLDTYCIEARASAESGGVDVQVARVSTASNGRRGTIRLVTRARVEEPILNLKLKIQCSDAANLSRSYALLIDPAGIVAAPVNLPRAEPNVTPAEVKPPKIKQPPRLPRQLIVSRASSVNALAEEYTHTTKSRRRLVAKLLAANPEIQSADQTLVEGTVLSTTPPAQTTRAQPSAPQTPPTAQSKPKPRLVISAGDVDEGTTPQPAVDSAKQLKLSYTLSVENAASMNEEARQLIRKKMQLINSDDQLAYLIKMQADVARLQENIDQLKQTAKVPGQTLATPQHTDAPTPPTGLETTLDWRVWGIAPALLLIVGLLFGWLWVRKRQEIPDWELDAITGFGRAHTEVDVTDSEMDIPLDVVQPQAAVEAEADLPPALNGTDPSIIVEDKQRWAIEEAQVFLSHGWVDHAISLLQEEIEQNTYDLELWLMLLDVFKVQKRAAEFAETARRFHVIAGSLPIWQTVCAMGQEVDEGNPLYDTHATAHLSLVEPAAAPPAAPAPIHPAPAPSMDIDLVIDDLDEGDPWLETEQAPSEEIVSHTPPNTIDWDWPADPPVLPKTKPAKAETK